MLAPSPPLAVRALAPPTGGAFSSGSLNIFAGMRTVRLLKQKRHNFFSMQFLPPVRCYRFTLFSIKRDAGCQSYTLFLRFSDVGKNILLAILVQPDTGSGALHKPLGAQQRQDDIPHDGEVIAVAPAFEGEGITVRDAGKAVGGKQVFIVRCTSSSVKPRRSTMALSKENFTFIL